MERTDFEQWKAREVARLLALVETERRYYQEMVASLPVALVVLSADRSIVSANRAFRHTFGMRSEDLRRKTIEQIIPSPRLVDRIRDAHVHGIVQPDVYVELEDRTLRVAIVPIRNWDEESELETLLMVEDLRTIGGMLAKMGLWTPATSVETPKPEPHPSDVAEAPSNEAAEATPTDLPPSIEVAVEPEPVPAEPAIGTADLPAVLYRVDAATFRFTSVTGAVERLLGYPASHWLESPQFFSERIHPDDRASAMAFFAAAAKLPGDASAEYRALSATGAVIWCRETIRVSGAGEAQNQGELVQRELVQPEPREPRSITGVITDITLRKQLEEQLLTAERRDALRGLASRLAHDLNNPLMIITGYSEEMLQSLPPSDFRREDMEQILGATARISGVTGDLLGFTRRLALPPQPVELGPFMAGIEDKIALAAGEGVALGIAAAAESVWAMADPVQLEEIILALVSSAREDAHERSRVIIGWNLDSVPEQMPEATLKPGLYARILIQDDGRGADAAGRMTIFESVLAGKDPAKNAGPGLARAYSIVREWDGDIAFASEPLRGSTFMLYLPYAPPEPPPVEVAAESVDNIGSPAPSEPEAEPAPPPVEVAPVEPPRETILLVEDEAGIRALVRKILSRERYVVLEAGSGEEALTIAQSHEGPIQLLMTDVMLPGIGGRDLAEALSKLRPEQRVLYISGYTDDEGVRAGWFPPGSRFLQKPFTLGALVSNVRETLDAE
jgi:signal transduction histidine kinase/CheY-like chemotaxis protein